MFVKPVEGRQVPDPFRGGLLPAEGREVEPNQFWLRRLEDGDVVECDPPEEKPVPAKKKEA